MVNLITVFDDGEGRERIVGVVLLELITLSALVIERYGNHLQISLRVGKLEVALKLGIWEV